MARTAKRFLQVTIISIFVVVTSSAIKETGRRGVKAQSSVMFVSWADTKEAITDLSMLSDQAALLNPDFTIYEGDLESSGFTQGGMDQWRAAMDGQLTGNTTPNGMFDIVFPVRGNHDSSNTSGWQSYFDFQATANRIGATNYTFNPGEDDLTYSFDYENAHFIGVDVTGDASSITSAQVQWIDTDLAAAEARGLTHAFIYFHGPIYCVDGHCSCSTRVCSISSSVQNLIGVLNTHPIVSATFHGHEHTYAHTYIDHTRIPPDGAFEGVTHPFHQFVTGDAGAGPNACNANRCDYNMVQHGFVTVDVNGPNVEVTFYQQGSMDPVNIISFTKEGMVTPTTTSTPTPTGHNTIRVPQDRSTIQAGINSAKDGDLVLVSPGVYKEQLKLSGKTITLASEFYNTGDPALIDQTIIDGNGRTVISVDSTVGEDTKIIGFTIRNGVDGISAYGKLHILNNRIINHSDGIDYEGGGGICRNNTLENNRDDGIDLDGPTEVTIEGNIIRNNSDDGIEIRLHAYSGPTLNIVIRDNTISGNGEDGIQLIDYQGLSDRVFTIERNLITNSAMVGLGLMDGGITTEDYRAASIPERIHLINNTFVNNPYAVTGGDNLIAINNLFVGSTVIALKKVDGGSIAAYQLFWNNGSDNLGSNIDTATTISANPLFILGYRLREGSPAIDAGTDYFMWKNEMILNLPSNAYYGAAPDIGKFENDGSPIDILFLPLLYR